MPPTPLSPFARPPRQTPDVDFGRRFRVPEAAPGRVFDALILPPQINSWFAQSIIVQARAGGAYAFWGKHTPFTDRAVQGTQQIIQLQPGTLLSFAWQWNQLDSVVSMTLSADGAGTALDVTHVGRGTVFGSALDSSFGVQDFWLLSIANLRQYLRTNLPALRPDYTDPAAGVNLSVDVDQPPAQVWAALAQSGEMERWIASSATADLRPGGAYSYGWDPATNGGSEGPSTVISAVPNQLLVTDWIDPQNAPNTQVRWQLQPLDGGTRTRLSLVHNVPSAGQTQTRFRAGWGKFLVDVKHLVEGRKIDPIVLP